MTSFPHLFMDVMLLVPVGKPNLMSVPEHDGIIENNEVSLLCAVQSGTPPITFKWYRVGNLTALHTVTNSAAHDKYVIPSASGVHSGGYYCEALNGAGNMEVSRHIILTGQNTHGFPEHLFI